MQWIQLTADAKQKFTTNLGGTSYAFHVKYNEISEAWTLDMAEAGPGTPILAGVPMVLGADLLAMSGRHDIGQIRAFSTAGNGTEAGADNLDTSIMLIFFAPGELE